MHKMPKEAKNKHNIKLIAKVQQQFIYLFIHVNIQSLTPYTRTIKNSII